MKPHRDVAWALILGVVLAAGCTNPLARVKETFEEGTASGFDATRLDKLHAAADEVAARSKEYGDEGLAQAGLLVSYAYVQAGRILEAEVALRRVELLVDETALSASNRALLTIVRADIDYEKALSLAMEDIEGHREAVEKHVASAVYAYDQARNSAFFASEPVLRQLFALREADILISAGNLWQLWDMPKAEQFYTRAVETAVEAITLDDALRARLVERALEATRLRKELGSLGP